MDDRFDREDPRHGSWTRRDALTLLGAGGTGLVLANLATAQDRSPGPKCLVRPAQIEGPYFVEEGLERSDIRSDPATGAIPPGTPLSLEFCVFAAAGPGCKPLPGVTLDVWHCDARGFYSDVEDPNFNTLGQRFLRGYQVTDATGNVRFRTIYPGSYAGRSVHIHFKIRYPLAPNRRGEFTSQVYFPESVTRRVIAEPPYTQGAPITPHDADLFYANDGGDQLLLDIAPSGNGYRASFEVALQDIFPA
jgi:protocatechuate 3,4-dioxygenase beta subunit